MCHKLLQVYACGHLKDVCTTPCPHALATGRQIPQDRSPGLSRSPSVISSSSTTPAAAPQAPQAPVRRRDIEDLPSQRHSQTPAQNSPACPSLLHVSSPAVLEGGAAPAFRFVAPGEAPPEYPPTSPTSPTSNEPSPTLSTTSILTSTPSPATPFFQADPEYDFSTVEPNVCAYHFPRYLPQSKVPCLACYGRQDWEGYRTAWMRNYQELHPNVKMGLVDHERER